MAEGVTYADLRFTKSPPEKSRPPADMLHEEASNSEGELTYENCAPAQPCQPTGPGPDLQPPGALGGRILSTVLLALLGACLFLLATCLGLGLRYWQVSRQLEGASRRHRAESGALAQQLGGQEENLTRTLRLLSRAQEELSATSLALRQSREAGNRTRRQLEGEQERAENCLTQLQQEKDKGVRELEAARSCQKIGCCPPDWTLFRWKCFWVSGERKAWEESKQDCGRQRAQLLVLKPWDASTIWGAIVITSRLRSDEFWIGLHGTWALGHGWGWHWEDGLHYAGTSLIASGYQPSTACGTLKQGQLSGGTCTRTLQYVCEKAASPEGPGWSA